MKKKRIENWKPDLVKEPEGKSYHVTYNTPKGKPVKVQFVSSHKVGSPEFNVQVHKEAGKLGHKGGMISSVRLDKNDVSAEGKGFLLKLSKGCCSLMNKKSKKQKDPKKFIVPESKSPLKRIGIGAFLEGKPKSSYREFITTIESRKEQSKKDEKMDKDSALSTSGFAMSDDGAKKGSKSLDGPHYNVDYDRTNKKVVGFFHPEGQHKKRERKYEVPMEYSDYQKIVKPIIAQHGRTVHGAEAAFASFKPKDVKKAIPQKIDGGLADKKDPTKYDPKQLEMGIDVEMEHTNDPDKAKEIAMDHLEEMPDYYTHLKNMEDKNEKQHKQKGDIAQEAGVMYEVNQQDAVTKFLKSVAKKINKVGNSGEVPPEAGGKLRRPMPLTERNMKPVKSKDIKVKEDKPKIEAKKPTPMGDLADEIVSSHNKQYSPVKKTDECTYELRKSFEDSWIYNISDTFRALARNHKVPYDVLTKSEGTMQYHIFKVGDCSVIHKTMGRFVDIKYNGNKNEPALHKQIAKELYAKLESFYYQTGIRKSDVVLNKKRALYGKQYSVGWQEGLGAQQNRRRLQTLRRKWRPQLGTKKPKSEGLRRLSRQHRRLMGAEQEQKDVGKSKDFNSKLTSLGKDFVKAFGAKISSPKISTTPKITTSPKLSPHVGGIKIKAPVMSAPKMSAPKSPKPIAPKMTSIKTTLKSSPIVQKLASKFLKAKK